MTYPSNYIEVEQRSEAWHETRLGKATASKAQEVMTKSRSADKPSETRENYLMQVIAERVRKVRNDLVPMTADIERGIEEENSARVDYEFIYSVKVDTSIGFIDHPTIANVGCSPDGLVGEDGMIEIKCPRDYMHLRYISAGVVPDKYLKQIAFQLACSGREWCDFVSYCKDFERTLKVIRVNRSDKGVAELIGKVEEAFKVFSDEANQKETAIRNHMAGDN